MNALATIEPLELTPQLSRIATFEKAVAQLPHNEYGLPVFIYRADVIPANLYDLDEDDKRQILQNAAIQISYREGYPTFETGIPMWGQMEWEASLEYEAFEVFLSLSNSKGYRQLIQLEFELRSLPQFREAPPDLAQLREMFTYNYWAQRAKAHDLFMVAAHKKLRESRIMSIENQHFLRSERLLDRMETQLAAIFDPERLAALDPEVAVKMIKNLQEMQRQALGLATQAGTNKAQPNDPPPNATMEVTLRQLAKQSGADLTTQAKSDSANPMEILLRDDNTAEMAQELIIKMSIGANNYQKPNVGKSNLDADADADQAMLGQ